MQEYTNFNSNKFAPIYLLFYKGLNSKEKRKHIFSILRPLFRLTFFQYAENMFPPFFAILKFCSTKHLFNNGLNLEYEKFPSQNCIFCLTSVLYFYSLPFIFNLPRSLHQWRD